MPGAATAQRFFVVPTEVLDRYVGSYDGMTVLRREARLYASMAGRTGELVPLSDTEFLIEEIGAPVRFERDAKGEVPGTKPPDPASPIHNSWPCLDHAITWV